MPQRNPFDFSVMSDVLGIGTRGRVARQQEFVRNRERFRAEQAGIGQQQILQKAAELAQSGQNPSQILQTILASPDFQDFFSSPEFSPGSLPKLIGQIANPQPEQFTLGPGQSRFESTPGSGEARRIANAPSGKVQTFTGLAELAELNDEEVAALARAQLTAGQGGSSTQSERAVARLLERGEISQPTADKLLSGALKTTPVIDPYGKRVGTAITDLTTNETVMKPATPTPSVGAPDPNDKAAQEGNVPPDKMAKGLLEDPADMFDVAGLPGGIVDVVGRLGGQVSTDINLEQISTKRQAMRIAKFALTAYRESGRLPVAELNLLQDLAPNTGAVTNPEDELLKGIQLHDFLQKRKALAQATRVDQNASTQTKIEADQEIRDIDRVLVAYPSREQMVAKLEEYKTQDGGSAVTLERGAELLGGEARKLVGKVTETSEAPLVPEGDLTSLSIKDLRSLAEQTDLSRERLQQIAEEIQRRLGQDVTPNPAE